MPKWSNLASFWKPEACGQTVLPDRLVLIGQKLVENSKIPKFKCDILSNFQTLWCSRKQTSKNVAAFCHIKRKWIFNGAFYYQISWAMDSSSDGKENLSVPPDMIIFRIRTAVTTFITVGDPEWHGKVADHFSCFIPSPKSAIGHPSYKISDPCAIR